MNPQQEAAAHRLLTLLNRETMIDRMAAEYLERSSLRDLERFYLEQTAEALESYSDSDLLSEFHGLFGFDAEVPA